MNEGESDSEEKEENFKAEITFNLKCHYNYKPAFVCMSYYFRRLLISP